MALFVAACGNDDDDTATSETTVDAADTSGSGAATAQGGSAGTGEVLADDETDGDGAEAWEAALRAAEETPLEADGEEIVIAMPNIEGSAAGSFPDVREGAQAAVKLINDKLGGIGADVAAGVPGRPIRLEVCAHQLDPSEAQACATKVQEAEPSLIIVGIEFFTPIMYPSWQGIPTIQTIPLFIADFDQRGNSAFNGGVVTQYAGQVEYAKEVQNADRVAVLVQDLAPAVEAFEDVHGLLLESAGLEYETFTDATGDPAVKAANIEAMMNYLEGAENPVIYGSGSPADCAEYLKGLATAGNTAPVVWAQSCVDASIEGLPAAEGVAFGFETYIADDPDLSPFVRYELEQRDQAIDDFGPAAPESTFMRTGFSAVAWAYQVMNQVAADGGDPSERDAIAEVLAAANNAHIVGQPPVDCVDVAPAYRSICGTSITFASWDGSQYVPDPEIRGEYLDVTDLLGSRPPRD